MTPSDIKTLNDDSVQRGFKLKCFWSQEVININERDLNFKTWSAYSPSKDTVQAGARCSEMQY